MERSEAVIKKNGSQYCVMSESGRNLGCYPTEEQARKRLQQIEFFKHKGASVGALEAKPHPSLETFEERAVASEDIDGIIERNIIRGQN